MAPTNEELSKLAKDAFYVTVGLGVMTVQKVQVRRREVQKHLGKRLENRVKTVEERLQALSSHGAA
jgi:chaperonin cofactor prefoldin